MKKIFKIISVSLFTIFSFYYTNRVVDLSKNEDPIMKEIKSIKDEYEIKPVNGVIQENTILVGSSGKRVDVDASYEKMKRLKYYDDSLLEYINIKPLITKDKNYEKLIIGSNVKKKISIVFQIDDIDIFNQILYIVDKHNIPVTLFMDVKLIENSEYLMKKIKDNKNISLGIYGYDNSFDIVSLNYVKNFLKKFNYNNYCLYKDDKFLRACKNYKINTIKPILVEKEVYKYLSEYKKEGYIYQIKTNKRNIAELNSSFMYLHQKGYKIVNLDDLLKE